ncbi:MAG TPA: right-handed parallel beta-helix repeat-containing protein [bacterium]|nr:right-handed parallel beta-helix repeat-containing protein [bacterium]
MAFLLALALPASLKAEGGADFSQLFTEKVLTVSRGGDGLLPGTLRTALIQASGIRAQSGFTLVKIVFDPGIDRVRVTKGPLPDLSGSLTTLDCQTPQGRVLIEGVEENEAGVDPTLEVAGLKITSSGNVVRNCHITGFRGPGILVKGNRNTIEFNTIGYHKDAPETSISSSALFGEPKTNQGAGILIGDGGSENLIQSNDIVANTFNGVEVGQGAGPNNKIVYNYFSKNSGQAIKVGPNRFSTKRPQITKVVQEGENFMISGVAEANVELQIYTVGKEPGEVGMIVVPKVQIPRDNFIIATKSKGFIPNQTKIAALAHGIGRNSSEFSPAIVIPAPNTSSTAPIEAEPAPAKPEAPAKEEPAEGEGVIDGEPETAVVDPDTPTKTVDKIPPKPAGQPKLPEKLPDASDTVINIQGMGEGSHEPDAGSMGEKSPRFGGLGF